MKGKNRQRLGDDEREREEAAQFRDMMLFYSLTCFDKVIL